MEVTSPRDEGDGNVKHSMAAQACETCRQRKVKCDEERPRCGVCRRLNVVCEYREAKPTKKDKTLVYILDTLKSLEMKIDRAISQGSSFSETTAMDYPYTLTQMRQQTLQLLSESNASTSLGTSSTLGSKGKDSPTPSLYSNPSTSRQTVLSLSFRNQVEARKLLSWPATRNILQNDLAQIPGWDPESDGGERWLLNISKACENPLPLDEPVSFVFVAGNTPHAWDANTLVLTTDIIENLCQTYFRSFHSMFPILDAYHFFTVTLPQAYETAFHQHDGSSTLVLLVLALGAVAQEGVSGEPILEESTRRSTGIRGGTVQRTPGLIFLNEARKRMGIMISAYDLTILQCFILSSVYYSQCSRNLDYWHMTALSCTLCQSLVRTVDNWKAFDSDLVARAYWMCILLEGGLTSELGLTPTGITDLENSVPLPLFLSTLSEKSNSDEELFIEYHFLAQITLRALLNRIHSSLRYFSKRESPLVWTTQRGLNESSAENPFQPENANETPPAKLILELSRQLHAWREHLPPDLNWNDDDPQYSIGRAMTPAPWQVTVLDEPVTVTLLDVKTVMNASLRTRYKYAQYLLWRPYIYKALHFPNAVTEEDLQGCREGLKACSLWPLTYPVFQDQRRLIPHIYEYSHTFFGILILHHVCLCNVTLRNLLEPFEDMERSNAYMLRWMRDMQVVHPVARWCWRLLRIVYKDHPLVGWAHDERNCDPSK